MTDLGERLPLSLGTDSAASDKALDRHGWVAVCVGYQVVALHDGDLLNPTRLPDAWSIAPAADPTLALVRRFFGRSRGDGEPEVIELVDRFGTVLRRVEADVWGTLGELSNGTIGTRHALLTWDGEQRPLPAPGEVIAVTSGRFVIIGDRSSSQIHVSDAVTGQVVTTSVPSSAFSGAPAYDGEAARVAVSSRVEGEPIVIVDAGQVRLVDAGGRSGRVAWVDHDHLLLVGDDTHLTLDIDSGAVTPEPGFPPRSVPRINLTGRFDADQLKEALRPTFIGPITNEMRESVLSSQRAALVSLLRDLGGDAESAAEQLTPAIRVRTLAPQTALPIGASRIGGSPDLPLGHEWPKYDHAPMMFIGQLRVDEINAALPHAVAASDGLIVMFAGIEVDGGYPPDDNAVHVDLISLEGLNRAQWPADLSDELRLEPTPVVLEPTWSPASTPGSRDDALSEAFERLIGDNAFHQMFGTPMTIQDHSGQAGHSLLFAFDGDPLVGGPMFGDGGQLLIWIEAPIGPLVDFTRCTVDLDSH